MAPSLRKESDAQMANTNAGASNFLTMANGLTYARLVLLPFVIVGLVTDNGWLVAGAMFLAWVTDLLDGRVARSMGQGGTPFGKALDSTVDFAFIYCLSVRAAGKD